MATASCSWRKASGANMDDQGNPVSNTPDPAVIGSIDLTPAQ